MIDVRYVAELETANDKLQRENKELGIWRQGFCYQDYIDEVALRKEAQRELAALEVELAGLEEKLADMSCTEVLYEKYRTGHKMYRYIAFVLTGDSDADAQLGADNIVAELAELKAAWEYVADIGYGIYRDGRTWVVASVDGFVERRYDILHEAVLATYRASLERNESEGKDGS